MAVSAWRAGVTLTDGATGRVYFGPDMRCSGLLLGSALAAISAIAVFAHGSSEFAYAAQRPAHGSAASSRRYATGYHGRWRVLEATTQPYG